jgi:hypothetical protein
MRTHSRETYKPTEKWDNVTEWGLTRLTSSLTRGRILQVATVHSINLITQVSHFPNRGAAGRDQYGLLTQIWNDMNIRSCSQWSIKARYPHVNKNCFDWYQTDPSGLQNKNWWRSDAAWHAVVDESAFWRGVKSTLADIICWISRTEGRVKTCFGTVGGYSHGWLRELCSFQPRHVFAQLSKLLVLCLSLCGELVATQLSWPKLVQRNSLWLNWKEVAHLLSSFSLLERFRSCDDSSHSRFLCCEE